MKKKRAVKQFSNVKVVGRFRHTCQGGTLFFLDRTKNCGCWPFRGRREASGFTAGKCIPGAGI